VVLSPLDNGTITNARQICCAHACAVVSTRFTAPGREQGGGKNKYKQSAQEIYRTWKRAGRWQKQIQTERAAASRWPCSLREDSSSKRGQCITRGEAARVMHASAPRADGSQTLTVRLRMQRLTLCRRLGSAISGLCCIAFRAAQKTLICCEFCEFSFRKKLEVANNCIFVYFIRSKKGVKHQNILRGEIQI
jgi:hypothetical protein